MIKKLSIITMILGVALANKAFPKNNELTEEKTILEWNDYDKVIPEEGANVLFYNSTWTPAVRTGARVPFGEGFLVITPFSRADMNGDLPVIYPVMGIYGLASSSWKNLEAIHKIFPNSEEMTRPERWAYLPANIDIADNKNTTIDKGTVRMSAQNMSAEDYFDAKDKEREARFAEKVKEETKLQTPTLTKHEQRTLILDTLNLEYEGPIKEHELIIKRMIPIICETKQSVLISDITHYPLVRSYKKRLASLANDYLQKNAKITKNKSWNCNIYELPDGLSGFNDIRTSPGEQMSEVYIEMLIRSFGISSYSYKDKRFLIAEDLKDEKFAKLVSEATKNGIKKTTTENGFYNRELAMRVSKGILLNKINGLLNFNKDYSYVVVYIADTYRALSELSDEGQWPGQNREKQNKMLEKMIQNNY